MPNDIKINLIGDNTLEKNVLQMADIYDKVNETYKIWQKMSKDSPFGNIEATKSKLKSYTEETEKARKAINEQTKAELALKKAQEEASKSLEESTRISKESTNELQKLSAEINAVKAANKALQKENKQTSEEFIENKIKLKELSDEYRQAEKLVRLKNKADKEAIGSNEKLKASVSLLTAQYNKLSDEERDTTKEGQKLTKELASQVYQLKKNEEKVGNHTRSVGDYQKALGNAQTHLAFLLRTEKQVASQNGKNSTEYKQLRSEINQTTAEVRNLNVEMLKTSMKDSVSSKLGIGGGSLGTLAMVGGGITAAVAATKVLFDATKETNKIQQSLLHSFDLTGVELDSVTVKVKTLANVYEKDYDEVIKATNAVSKEMGISASDALKHIEEGFSKGSDNTGEFLDMLREYPAQFKAAGIQADLMFSIINKSVKEGIYSDKGADAIKEGMLRLREITPVTQAALKNIGFTSEEVQDAVANGSLATWDGMKKVSSKISELKENSPKVGQALADIFGGAGEDAGYRFISMLKDVDENLQGVTETATKFTTEQYKLTEAWNRLVVSITSDGSYLNDAFTGMMGMASKTLDIISTGSLQAANLLETAREIEKYSKNSDAHVSTMQNAGVTSSFDTSSNSLLSSLNPETSTKDSEKRIEEIIKTEEVLTDKQKAELEKRKTQQKEFYKKELEAALYFEQIRIENMEEGFDKERDAENLRYRQALLNYEDRFKGTENYHQIVEEETEKHLKNIANIYKSISTNTENIGIPIIDSASEAESISKNINVKLNIHTTPLNKNQFDLAEFLGLDDESLAFIESQLSYLYGSIMDFMSSIADARVQDLEDQISITDEKISNTESALDVEKEAKENGYANNYDLKVQELADLKKQKAQEEAELAKAQKKKANIAKLEAVTNSATTSSNIILSGTELMKAHAGIPFVGIGIAAGLIATMLGMVTKLRAASKGYFDGTEYVELGNNPKGRDTIPVNVHEGERIVPTAINKKLKGVKNSDLPLIMRQAELYRLKNNLKFDFGQVELNSHNNSMPFEYTYLQKQNELLSKNNVKLQKLVDSNRNRTDRVTTPKGYTEFIYSDGVLVGKNEIEVK